MAHEYTKNLWSSGDVITATKLNLIDDELVELNEDVAALEQSVDSTLTAAQSMVDDAVEQLTQTVNNSNANLAATYDENSTYNVGDYVVYNNSLWRCRTVIEEPEEWTSAHWSLTFMGRELSIIIRGEEPNTWDDVQYAVQKGYGPQLYPVGTQFTVHHDTYGDMIFDVVSHNYHKNPNNINAPTMTLLTHDLITTKVFDDKEALYTVIAANYPNGLPAGTYYFNFNNTSAKENPSNWTYVGFTLTQNIPVNGQIVFNQWSANSNIANVTLKTYANGLANSLIEQNITLSNTNTGVYLGTIVNQQENFNGYMNTVRRARSGSNNWKMSNIRQWLNATTSADWWTPQSVVDRLHSSYYSAQGAWSLQGFQYGLDENFIHIIQPVNLITPINNTFEIDPVEVQNAYSITTDKFFIPTAYDVQLQKNNDLFGTGFTYYLNATNETRVKYRVDNNSAAAWWLRSPDSTNTSTLNLVRYLGTSISYAANQNNYIAAACVIY